MSKNSKSKKEQYPIEFPDRSNTSKNAPIVDVLDNETYPRNFNTRHHSGVHIESFDDVSEVISTEINPYDSRVTDHGL